MSFSQQIVNNLKVIFFEPTPKTIYLVNQSIITKTILFIEMIFTYILYIFLLIYFYKNRSLPLLIIFLFSLEILYIIVSFESTIGAFVRHRYFFWKLPSTFGLIYFFHYLEKFFKMKHA